MIVVFIAYAKYNNALTPRNLGKRTVLAVKNM